MDSNAEQLLELQQQLESTRGVWEAHWREVSELVRPNANLFQQRIRPDGDKRTQRIFDDTAQLALPKFVAAVISMAFPATQQYHRLTHPDPKIADDPAAKRWFEEVNELLFRVRYGPHANFQAQLGEVVADVGAFGTGILYVDDVTGIGIRYKSFPLAETYLAEDSHGRVNRLHRKFELTARQAVSMFDPARLSDGIKAAAEKTPMAKHWFLHVCAENDDYNPAAFAHPTKGKRFKSCYIEIQTKSTVADNGYRTFPFCVPRFETAPREVYGRGPAMKVLPTIKTLNEMKKTILRAAQKVVDPPLLTVLDDSLQAFDLRSGALNHGYLGSNGEPLAKPFESAGRVDIGLDLMDREREAINDAFFVTLFRILVEEPQITATEAMLRAQEKGQLLAPTMGRMQSEVGGPLIERELDILSMNGALPPLPPVLQKVGAMYQVEYESPLNQAQKAGEGIAIMQGIQAMGAIAQFDRSVLGIVDMHDAARRLLEVGGFPQRSLRTDEEATALAEQAAQQVQQQQLLNAAPVAASAAKDFAQAAALAGSSPTQAPANLGLPA